MAGRREGRYGSLNRSRCHLTNKNECESQIRMQPARRSKRGTPSPNRFSSQAIPLPNFIPLCSSMIYSVSCISPVPALASFNLVLLAGNGLRVLLREALGKEIEKFRHYLTKQRQELMKYDDSHGEPHYHGLARLMSSKPQGK